MIEFRKAGYGDINGLIRLRLEFLNEVQKVGSPSEDAALKAKLKDYFMVNMKAGSFSSWIAVDNGVIVGTSGICYYALPPSYNRITGNVAYIMNMYTQPAYRGKGIAPSLFEKLLVEAKDRGCHKISLNATEMGRPLYMKFGFKESNDEMVLTLS